MTEKEKKEKKGKVVKEQKLVDLEVSEENQLLVNGKRKLLKNFDHFSTEEEAEIKSFDLDAIKKEKLTISFASIDFRGSSRFQERCTEGALKKLIISISERGILTPINVTLSKEDEDSFDCLDGFTRGLAIEALMDREKLEELGLGDLKIVKEWSMDSEIEVLCYTKQDGLRLDDEDCYRIARMGNTIRAKWNLIDIANSFKFTLRREVTSKLGTKMDENPQLKEHVENLFENGTPLIILNGLMHANILKASEIGILKEKVFKELEKDTGLSKADLQMYSRIAEIPSEFYSVITGNKNHWGIILSPKNAIDLFINTRGQCKPASAIKKLLDQLKLKANPRGMGNVKVTGSQAGELADALSEEGSSKQRKINSTERNVALMLIEHFAKKGQVKISELPVLMDSYQNALNLDDFCETFSTKTEVTLPEVTRFMIDREAS